MGSTLIPGSMSHNVWSLPRTYSGVRSSDDHGMLEYAPHSQPTTLISIPNTRTDVCKSNELSAVEHNIIDGDDLQDNIIYEEITTAHCIECDMLVDIKKNHHSLSECVLMKEFSCSTCGGRFNYNQNLKVHMITSHSSPESYNPGTECEFCDSKTGKRKTFQRFHAYVAHIKSHFILDNYFCKHCSEEFPYFALYKRHRRIVHDKSTEQNNRAYSRELGYCPKCNKLIECSKISAHKLTHALHMRIDNKRKRRAGAGESAVGTSSVPPPPNGDVESTALSLAAADPVTSITKANTCSVCGKSFRRPSELRRHHAVHDKVKRFSCTLCDKKFVHESGLLSHVKNIHTNTVREHVCGVCGLMFTKASNVERHVKTNHPLEIKKALFDCPECACQFGGQIALKRHIHLVHDMNEYAVHQCDICQAVFPRKWSLLRHKRVHTMKEACDRPYKCNRCVKRYKLRSSLKLHMDLHARKDIGDPVLTDPKCPICLKHISSQRNLRKHMMIHQSNYECPDCFQRFATLHRLDRHRCVVTNPLAATSSDVLELVYMDPSASVPLNVPQQPTPMRTATKSYFCKTCPMSFYSFKAFKDHKSLHRGLRPYLCWTCHKSFRTSDLLALHKEIHSREPIYCEFCPLILHGRVQYGQHVRAMHLNTVSEPQTVVRFPDQEREMGVMSSQSYPDIDLNGRELAEGLFQTRAVSASADAPESRPAVDGHHGTMADLPNHHDQQQRSIWSKSDQLLNSDDTVETVADRAMRCSVCLHLYDSIQHLSQHWQNSSMEQHHSFAVIQCPVCEQSLRGTAEAAAHVNDLHPYIHSAPHRMLSSHSHPSDAVESLPLPPSDPSFLMPNSDKRHWCMECNAAFQKPSDLEKHIRVHTGERPFQCDICLRSFRVRSALNAHVKTHDRGPPEELCTVCNKSFYTRNALKLHLRIHSGEKPLNCRYCPLSFRTSSARKSHENRVHDMAPKHTCTRRGCSICMSQKIQNKINRRVALQMPTSHDDELPTTDPPHVAVDYMESRLEEIDEATHDSVEYSPAAITLQQRHDADLHQTLIPSHSMHALPPPPPQSLLYPVKLMSVNQQQSQSQQQHDTARNVRDTMAEFSRVAPSALSSTHGSAFATKTQQPSAPAPPAPAEIHITAKRISMYEYTVIVSRKAPKAIREGIDTTSSVYHYVLERLAEQQVSMRLALMDQQQLSVAASGVLRALGSDSEVVLRARPADPLHSCCVEILPPVTSEFQRRCDICDVDLPTKEISDAHMTSEDHETAQVLHPATGVVQTAMGVSTMAPAAVPPNRTKETDFTCKLCGRKYLDMEPLVAHIRRDHERDNPMSFQPRPAARTAPPLEKGER